MYTELMRIVWYQFYFNPNRVNTWIYNTIEWANNKSRVRRGSMPVSGLTTLKTSYYELSILRVYAGRFW